MKSNPSDALTTASRAAVGAVLGLATLVATFVVSAGALYQMARLDYDSTVNSLIGAAAAALLLFSLAVWYSPVQSRVTGQKRTAFIRLAAWSSLLLPLETFIECAIAYKWGHSVAFRSGVWWFTIPSQFIVGGLLGLCVALANHKSLWAIWGIVCTLWGAFWIATVLFWAH
jgi:hypothetical protein